MSFKIKTKIFQRYEKRAASESWMRFLFRLLPDSNPIWILGLRLILYFAGLKVRAEAVPTECQYFQTTKHVANGVIFHPLCSGETLTVLRRSIFLRLRVKTSAIILCIQLPILNNLNQFLDSLYLYYLVLGDMIPDSTDVVVFKPWI